LTLCTQGRAQFFGEIQAGKMIPNKEGKIAESYWKAIPEHFPNAILHDFVIMPNHIHGIIELIEPVGVEYFPPL
jgi:REP element-mobilizing transposase RayT